MAKVRNSNDFVEVSFGPDEFIQSEIASDLGTVNGGMIIRLFVQQKLEKMPLGNRLSKAKQIKTSFEDGEFKVRFEL